MNHFVITIASPKGGVGKTTTAVNIASGLALSKKKTLLIDLDPTGCCSTALGYAQHNIFGHILDLFNHSADIKDIIHNTEIPNLEIIPFAITSLENEKKYNDYFTNKSIFYKAIQSIKAIYDYIIIDCPPTLIGATENSLIASDYLIVPVKSAKFSLEAVGKMMNFVESLKKRENPKLQVDGLLLTMYERNTKVAFQIKKELFMRYPNIIFKSTIPKNISVAESTFYNKPVILFNPNAAASKAYLSLVDELVEKHETSSLMQISGLHHYNFA